ncbi:MAG TPA: ABC transporter permease [Spirochaetales bacterium]|nr:ABC transporter permease [Spirochaetales bacterium]HRY55062.1 ABC transporter permease [Spirochaetia bacterium]HRZ64223.1 ABC transporter permease [Spirochaetia bacterium]
MSDTVSMKKRGQFKETWRRFTKNKGAVIGLGFIALLAVCALIPSVIAPYGFDDQLLSRRFQSPSGAHLFGTDEYGRDIFSRVVYGCRISLTLGLVSVTISCALGIVLGCVAGYYGKVADNVIMRVIDVMLSIPNILLAVSIVAALGTSFFNLMLAIGIGAVPGYARVVRAAILSVKEQEYIEAARSNGASDLRIIVSHIVPNCMAPIIVQATMSIASAVLSAAGMSFIGLGIMPPTPEWGSMLSSGRAYIRDYWYVVTFPGLAIMLTVFSINLLGDGLRDALDPRLKS